MYAPSLLQADSTNKALRYVNAAGILSTVAGSLASAGSTGDGGPASLALMSEPIGTAPDGSGGVYVSDYPNGHVRYVRIGTVTQTPSSTRSMTPTQTRSRTQSPSYSGSPTVTQSPSPSQSSSRSLPASLTSSPSPTMTQAASASATPSLSPSASVSASSTPSLTTAAPLSPTPSTSHSHSSSALSAASSSFSQSESPSHYGGSSSVSSSMSATAGHVVVPTPICCTNASATPSSSNGTGPGALQDSRPARGGLDPAVWGGAVSGAVVFAVIAALVAFAVLSGRCSGGAVLKSKPPTSKTDAGIALAAAKRLQDATERGLLNPLRVARDAAAALSDSAALPAMQPAPPDVQSVVIRTVSGDAASDAAVVKSPTRAAPSEPSRPMTFQASPAFLCDTVFSDPGRL